MACTSDHYQVYGNGSFIDELESLAYQETVICDASRTTCYNIPLGYLSCGKQDNSNNPLDYVVVSIVVLLCIPFIIANGVMVWRRRYRPIRAKGVDVTVTSSLGGLIWIASTLVVNHHFRREFHTFWSLCTTWTFWLQILFGFALWLCCLIVRLYRLYCVFKLQMRPIKHIWVPLGVLLLPTLIFCICASAQHATHWDTRREDCVFKNTLWIVGALIIVPIYFIILLVLAYSLRNIRDEFNEYSSIRNGGIMAFCLFFLGLVTLTTKTYLEVTGRAFFSLAVAAEVFYYFWARNWYTVYMTLRHRKAYLKQFETTLRIRGGLNRTRGNLEHLDASAAHFVEPDASRAGDYKVAEIPDYPQGDQGGDTLPVDNSEKEPPLTYNDLARENSLLKEREATLAQRIAQLEKQQSKGAVTPVETL